MHSRQEQLQEWKKSKQDKDKKIIAKGVCNKENQDIHPPKQLPLHPSTQPIHPSAQPLHPLAHPLHAPTQPLRPSTRLPPDSHPPSGHPPAHPLTHPPTHSASRPVQTSLPIKPPSPLAHIPLTRQVKAAAVHVPLSSQTKTTKPTLSTHTKVIPNSKPATVRRSLPIDKTVKPPDVPSLAVTLPNLSEIPSNTPCSTSSTQTNDNITVQKEHTEAEKQTDRSCPTFSRSDISTQTESMSFLSHPMHINSLETSTDVHTDEISQLRAKLAEANRLEEAYVFSHEVLLQQMGEQRGKFNRLLQEEYSKHANEVACLKAAQREFETAMSSSIDAFRASTVTVLKSHVDKINLLSLENAELKAENAELFNSVFPNNV